MDFLTANDRPGRYPDSYYAATTDLLDRQPALAGDVDADVCIVGGGYTGLSAALHCAERGLRTVLLEAHRVGWGASGRNGGQLGSGQRVDQLELERRFGQESARRLWELAVDAVDLTKTLVARHGIDCQLKPGVLHVSHRARYADHDRRIVAHLAERYGYDGAHFVSRDELYGMLGTDIYHSGVLDMNAGHLHPLRYAVGLARAARGAGASIFETSRVTRIEPGARPRVETAAGAVTCNHLLLGCNGYLGDLAPQAAARVMPINNFIIATEPLGDDLARGLIRDDVAVADSRFVVNYWRLSADKRLLFGGRESYRYSFPKDIRSFVRRAMLKVYPQLADKRIDYGWGGTLAITMNRLPCFQRLGGNILSCSGYSGHGVGLATLAGKLSCDAIRGQAEGFDSFAMLPAQRFPGGAMMRWPLLVLGMTYYSLRDRF